jgi:hypothetical protein
VVEEEQGSTRTSVRAGPCCRQCPILHRARVDVPDAATRRILCDAPEGLELFAAQLKSGTVGGIIDGHRDPPLIVKAIAEILLVEGE